MAGSIGGIAFPIYTGELLDSFEASGNITAGYAVLFAICSSAYLIAFALHHALAPQFEPLALDAQR
jgi:MFS transporter, ACS family, hexuronate transporter